MQTESTPTFLDPEIQKCPYSTYDFLREEHPVYLDPKANLYVVTRYEDVGVVMLDPVTFSSLTHLEGIRDQVLGERAQRMRDLYVQKGWTRGDGSLGMKDGLEHR